MIGSMNKVINNSIKPNILKHIFYSKTLLFSSEPGFNSFSDLPRIFPYRHIHSERRFTTCRHCSLLLGYQFPDKFHSISSNNPINYSTFLRECSKNYTHSVQESQKRYKSKKPQKRPEYDSDSDEDDDNEGMSKATKPATLRLQSLRLDGLLKKSLGIARNKAETAFYEGDIRVNGTKPTKKSYQVKMGDEVDLIKGVSPLNPDFLTVSRVEVLAVKEDTDEGEEKLIVKVRRTKTMYIENYETDPWKKSSSAE